MPFIKRPAMSTSTWVDAPSRGPSGTVSSTHRPETGISGETQQLVGQPPPRDGYRLN